MGGGQGALEAAQESVASARERGNEATLPYCYRVLAEALLASDAPGKITAAREALDGHPIELIPAG